MFGYVSFELTTKYTELIHQSSGVDRMNKSADEWMNLLSGSDGGSWGDKTLPQCCVYDVCGQIVLMMS